MITSSDFRSEEVGFKIYNHILKQTGKCPSVVMSVLHREKLDPNRDDTNGKATFNEPEAKMAYEWYHGNITDITKSVSDLYGEGLLLPLHGYKSENISVKWTAIGKHTILF